MTLFNYGLTRIWKANDKNRRLLVLGITVNVGILVFFKYTNFLVGTVNDIGGLFGSGEIGRRYNIVLPVGISFFLFQVTGYLIDVYWGKVAVQKHLVKFALYVNFFPQLVAGPIERAGRLMPQLDNLRAPTRHELITAVSLIGWGLFKKVVIADNIESVVGYTFTNDAQGGLFTTLIGLYSFSLQVFCDFSAYTDIAIGSALLFGVRLINNFQDPYYAVSLREYWTKWHISLTSWFTDYVYYPLCLNRKFRISPAVGILFVFTLSGFWHGASWTFVAWGVFHGILLALEYRFGIEKRFNNGPVAQWVKRIVLFNVVALSWIFFRASDFTQSWNILTRLADFSIYQHDRYQLLALSLCSLPVVISFLARRRGWTEYNGSLLRLLGWGLVGWFGVIVAIVYGVDESREFIYFQF